MTQTHLDLSTASGPVLSRSLLARVHEINLDYVELLVGEACLPEPGAQLNYLPDKLLQALSALTPAARSALANAPFTLYSLGFEDSEFWRAATGSSAGTTVHTRYAATPAATVQQRFCELALLHAWHVAASGATAARVLYSMPETTSTRLQSTPLWQLRRIAHDYPGLLMPRWPTNPRFWPDLVHFAAVGDARRLATAQLLGAQLIAAELEAATASSERRVMRSPVALRSPHLRAKRLRLEARIR